MIKILRTHEGENDMYFSQLLKEINEILLNPLSCKDIFNIEDIALLDSSHRDYDKNTLYFGYGKQLNAEMPVPAHCILGYDELAILPGLNIQDLAIVKTEILFNVFNAAKSILEKAQGKGLYGELQCRADQSHDVDAVLNAASIKLGNSLILVDTDFKVISYSTSIPVTDKLWNSNIEKGYCSYEFISAVRQFESIQNESYSTDVVEVSCPESPYRKLCSKVFFKGVHVGFVLMIESGMPIRRYHLEMLETVSRAISYVITKYVPYLFHGNSQYQKLLYDLLIGTPPEDLSAQIAKLTFSPMLIVLFVQPTSFTGERYLKENLTQILKDALPGTHVTYHESGIVALISLGSEVDITKEQMEKLGQITIQENVHIGISNCFSRIDNFARHFTQAKSALQLGTQLSSESTVFRYLNFQFYDLLSHVKNPDTLRLYCHPALDLIRKYDFENGTELCKTLRIYLDCGCSIKLASEKLFVHRNSLSYRLECIGNIGHIDLNAADTQFLLRVAYMIENYMLHL